MRTTHPLATAILDAAEEVVVGDGLTALGYGTIAERMGVERATVRDVFPVYEQLLTRLFVRMTTALAHTVIDNIERDPLGGLPSRIYGYALTAIFEAPLARALYFRSPIELTNAVRAIDGVGWVPPLSVSSGLLPALQEAGVARTDIDTDDLAALLDAIGAGAALSAQMQQLENIAGALIMLLERSVDADVTDTSAGKAVAQSYAGALLTAASSV